MDGAGAAQYRRWVAVLNYLAQDRLDLSYAVKEAARSMATPHTDDGVRLKRILRYLQGAPRASYVFKLHPQVTELVGQVDSDWAGCTRTRRSTSCRIIYKGLRCLAHWSRTQATIALSSGEAELNAALKGAAELLGAQEMMRELHVPMTVRLEGDSSACEGIVSREGCGRIKHLQVRQLWIQEKFSGGQLTFTEVPRDHNTADCQTKHWGADAHKHFQSAGFKVHTHTHTHTRTARN